MLFGVLLVVYMFVALAAMNLLFIQREVERWQRSAGVTPPVATHARSASKGEASESFATPHPRPHSKGGAESAEVARAARRIEENSHVPLSPRGRGASGEGRCRLANRLHRPEPLPSMLPPYCRPTRRPICWSAVCSAARSESAWAALVVAAICFFSLPRFGQSTWAGGMSNQKNATIGFSQDVKLGDLGPLLQNPELAMRISFIKVATGEAIMPTTPPLLRGSLVTEYSHGEWRHAAVDADKSDIVQVRPLPNSASRIPLVRQQIMIEPMSEPVIFAVYPAFEANPGQANRQVLFDVDRQQLVRTPDVQNEKFEYQILTIGLTATEQCRILPQPNAMDPAELERMLAMPDDIRGPNGESTGVANPNAEPSAPADRFAVICGEGGSCRESRCGRSLRGGQSRSNALFVRAVRLFAQSPTAGPERRSDRGFRRAKPRWALRVFRQRRGADASQPGDSSPIGDWFPRR